MVRLLVLLLLLSTMPRSLSAQLADAPQQRQRLSLLADSMPQRSFRAVATLWHLSGGDVILHLAQPDSVEGIRTEAFVLEREAPLAESLEMLAPAEVLVRVYRTQIHLVLGDDADAILLMLQGTPRHLTRARYQRMARLAGAALLHIQPSPFGTDPPLAYGSAAEFLQARQLVEH